MKNDQNDIIDVVLVFLLLTLNIFHTVSSASIINFEEVNFSWVRIKIKLRLFLTILLVLLQ